jgi:hypothetical protein
MRMSSSLQNIFQVGRLSKTLFTIKVIFRGVVATAVAFFALALPQFVRADACADLKAKFTGSDGQALLATLPAYCTTGAAYTRFLNLAFAFIGTAATIMIMYGGFLYLTAAGNDKQVQQGRSIATYAIGGLILVLVAAVATNLIVRYVTTGL